MATTYVRPVALWGTEIKGLFQVVTGRTPVALVKPEGKKLKVLSVHDRRGGKPGEFGMTAPAVMKQIRQAYGRVLSDQARTAVDKAAKHLGPRKAVALKVRHPFDPDRPIDFTGTVAEVKFGTESEVVPATAVWYWSGGNLWGQWNRAWPGTRPALIRAGYYAVEAARRPRECPPAAWFDNFHKHGYREGMIALG